MIDRVEITGDKAIDDIFTNLGDALQRKVVISAFRKAARPMVNEMRRQAPEGDKTYINHLGQLHIPGTLKKSHGIVNGKSKRFPAIWVGPRYGKRFKYDGFYFRYIIEGSPDLARHIKNPVSNWIERAGKSTQAVVESVIRVEIGKALDRKMQSIIRRHG